MIFITVWRSALPTNWLYVIWIYRRVLAYHTWFKNRYVHVRIADCNTFWYEIQQRTVK